MEPALPRPVGETWLESLKWLLVGLPDDPQDPDRRRGTDDAEVTAHAVAVVRDWEHDHPHWEQTDPYGPDRAPVAAAAHRLQFLDCMRNAVGGSAWLDALIRRHVAFLVGTDASAKGDSATYPVKGGGGTAPRWLGPTNRGLDQSLAVLGAACELGRRDWYAVATRRMGRHAALVFDRQGVNNEQAAGYEFYNLTLWDLTLDRLRSCGGASASPLGARLQAADAFLAMATRPDGHLEQLGDTEDLFRGRMDGGQEEYASSGGSSGTRPTRLVGVYDSTNGGYVLGHSGWGSADRPLDQESFWSLRFGKGRIYHGHDDHTSLTYYARGQQLLADGGHAGYDKGAYRDYLLSPAAHNVVTADAAFDEGAATRLTASDPADGAFTVRDAAYSGVVRQRSMLALVPPQQDVLLVADTLTSRTAHTYTQLWHLGTSFRATVAGGRAAATADGTTLTVLPVTVPGARAASVRVVRGQKKPLQGWVSKHFYEHTPTSTVQVSTKGTSALLLTAVIPSAAGSAVSASAVASPAGGWDVTVTTGAGDVTAHLSAAGVLSR